MPLYEYECKRCGKVFEVLQRHSSKPLTVHEGCGGALERLLSPPALQFKGTGWYVTDYARGSGASNAPAKHATPAPAPKTETTAKPSTDK